MACSQMDAELERAGWALGRALRASGAAKWCGYNPAAVCSAFS